MRFSPSECGDRCSACSHGSHGAAGADRFAVRGRMGRIRHRLLKYLRRRMRGVNAIDRRWSRIEEQTGLPDATDLPDERSIEDLPVQPVDPRSPVSLANKKGGPTRESRVGPPGERLEVADRTAAGAKQTPICLLDNVNRGRSATVVVVLIGHGLQRAGRRRSLHGGKDKTHEGTTSTRQGKPREMLQRLLCI